MGIGDRDLKVHKNTGCPLAANMQVGRVAVCNTDWLCGSHMRANPSWSWGLSGTEGLCPPRIHVLKP